MVDFIKTHRRKDDAYEEYKYYKIREGKEGKVDLLRRTNESQHYLSDLRRASTASVIS